MIGRGLPRSGDQVRMLDAELLGEFEAVLALCAPELLARTPPGPTADEIVAAFERERVAPSVEAVRWWSWRDGSLLSILPGMQHLTFEIALGARHALRDLVRDVAERTSGIPVDRWWSLDWLLIFGSGGLPKFALECGAAPEDPSPLRQVEWDRIGSSSYAGAVASSLGEYIERAVRFLRDGGHRYDTAQLPMDWTDAPAGERL